MGDLISTSRAEEPNCHIFTHSGLSATITGSFAAPGGYGLSWGLTMDRNGNLLSTQTDYVYFLSGVSDVATGSIAISPGNCLGMAVDDDNNLIHSSSSTDHIYVHSGLSSTITGSFASPKGLNPIGLAVDSNNNLIQIENAADYIFVHSGISSTLTGSFASPASSPQGLTIDADDNLISSDENTVYIYVHDGISSTLTGSFAGPAGKVNGIALQITAPSVPYEYEPVYTKIDIGGTTYADAIKIDVDRTIGEFNATSSFTVEFNNFNGQYNDTFSLNDEVIIYADRGTTPPTTKIFTGIIENISFKGDVEKEKIIIIGRDYGAIMLDMTVQPIIYKNTDAGIIARQVILNNTEELLTANNVDTTTGTTIERIGFNQVNVFSAIQELAELSSYYFYVDNDKDVHFEAKASTSSEETFDNTNVTSAVFKEDDKEIYNKVWVYGARVLTGANDTGGTWGAGQTGSVFQLSSKPHNVRVSVGGTLQQPGGIYEMTNPATESGLKYVVDFNEKDIIFVSGTAAGENVPASGTSNVSVDYERYTPLLKYVADDTSVTNYGPKTKIIKDDNLKSYSEVNEKATTFLADNKDPKIQGDLDIKGVVDLTPGNTCVVDLPWHGIDEQTYTILSAAYSFNKYKNRADNVLHITVNKKLSDFTDVMKEQIIKLKRFEVGPLEGEYTNLKTALKYADVDTHYEVWQRDINNNFVFHSAKHGKLESPDSRIGTGELGSTFIESGGGF